MMKDVKQKFVDQEFTNTATIHFDYTDFRVTNTVSSILSRFTSIENLKTDLDFNAYPNPASNQLFVMSKKKAVFNIYSAIGEKVLQTELTANETTSIDISTWASGIYIISNGTSSTKFVVQH